jgi:hypothetical protein
MTEYLAGPTMVMTWAYSGGTIALNADYRTCSWNPSIAYVDASAGQDTQVGRLTALKDATASIELVNQTAGTAIQVALQPGVAGTLTIQPEGTATNKRKITFPAYSDGGVQAYPYADIAVTTCGFTGAGSVLGLWTDGVNT